MHGRVLRGPGGRSDHRLHPDAINVETPHQRQFETMEHIVGVSTRRTRAVRRSVNLVPRGTAVHRRRRCLAQTCGGIAEEHQPFVVLGGPALTSGFADELAAREIRCISCPPAKMNNFYVERDRTCGGSTVQMRRSRPLGRVHHQAADRQERRARGRRARRSATNVRLVYLESSAASKDLADSVGRDGGRRARRSPRSSRTRSIRPESRRPFTGDLEAERAGVTTVVFKGEPGGAT